MSVDVITTEVIGRDLVAIADEMKRAIERTAMSPVIYEVLDFSTGIFDARSRLMAQAAGLAIFLGTLDWAVAAAASKFKADLKPGDIILTNDPYEGGGTHLNDVCVIAPVFYDGELQAFVASRAHWMDIGGASPLSVMTDAEEIYQEGLRLPVVKAYDGGEPVPSLLDTIRANVRDSDVQFGDFRAQIAACRTGERRLHDLFGKYGVETVAECSRLLMDAAEVTTRERIGDIPDGEYRAEEFLDNTGRDGRPVRVVVTVTKRGGDITCDFTGTDRSEVCPRSSYNMGYCALVSAMRVIFKALTDPWSDANDGSFRSLTVTAEAGTVVRAVYPTPVSMYGEVGRRAIDAVWRALAPAIPGRLPAGHYGTICGQGIAGYDDRYDQPRYVSFSAPNGGGWGATADRDGENALICVTNGDTRNTPVEIIEARNPLIIGKYELRCDSGGPGRFRGGLGTTIEYEVTTGDRYYATFAAGRCLFPPFGIEGGGPGAANRVRIRRGTELLGGLCRATKVELNRGDRIEVSSGGGGGLGDPAGRPAAMVERDVKWGYVSQERAAVDYGQGTEEGLPEDD